MTCIANRPETLRHDPAIPEVQPSSPSACDPASSSGLSSSELQGILLDMPDARERLAYVSQMTNTAAHRVLGLVEQSKPVCADVASQGRDLAEMLGRMAANDSLDVTRARALLRLCATYATRAADFAQQQNDALGDILIAQDFQDLSGQVIKKTIHIIERAEQQLVNAFGPVVDGDRAPAAAEHGQTASLAGPQAPDKALQQDDVDDLLASLGF
jgi:chemotaxis protein CheZ